MRTALVTDWLVTRRGGEKVFEALLELFPRADVFTLVQKPGLLGDRLEGRKVTSTALQRVPGGVSHHRWFLPFYDHFMAGLDLSAYDLIVSGSSACAKWVRNPRHVPHVCYCHTPMRYVWDLFDDYFGPGRASWPVRCVARAFRGRLQRQDLMSNEGVTHFLANSTFVRERIQRLYGRESEVLHPPIDVGRFRPSARKGEHFLVLSALVPYKRVDLAVLACSRRGWNLVVAGDGPERRRLEKMAGPTVRFTGPADDDQAGKLLAEAKALLFPGLEDFGMVPVEALASGTPVVAYGRGGVLDSLEDGVTGTFFYDQTVKSLEAAMDRLDRLPPLDPAALLQRALPFSKESFRLKALGFFRRLYNRPAETEWDPNA